MPIVSSSDYDSPSFIYGGHFQTIYPTLFRPTPKINYQRERVSTPDGDFLDLDWSRVGAKRLMIALHGLEGSTESKYMGGIVQAFNREDWDGLGLNFRGCSGEPNLLPRAYHSGETGDLDFVINHALRAGGYTEIVLVGFSLGGNVTLKYLGEKGNEIRPEIKAAAAISVPCDLAACSIHLERRDNWIYMQRFMRRLKQKVYEKQSILPADMKVEGMTNFFQFDTAVTARLHGFKDADDYYAQCSSRQFIQGIRTPTLLIMAENDPFLAPVCYPYEEAKASDWLYLETPESGGHVGFAQFGKKGEYWHETRVRSFVNEKQKINFTAQR